MTPLRQRVAKADPLIEQVSLALLTAAEDAGTVDTLYRDALTNALLAHLSRHHTEGAADDRVAGRSYELPKPRARRAVAFMEAELQRPIGLDVIAREVGLSTSHFAAQFRRTFGHPPARYLTWLRLERAREMLAAGTLPIHAVATSVGFVSRSHFAQPFRAQYGVSPSSMRGEGAASSPNAGGRS